MNTSALTLTEPQPMARLLDGECFDSIERAADNAADELLQADLFVPLRDTSQYLDGDLSLLMCGEAA